MTVDQAIAALADFLQPLMPAGTSIVRAQVNRVPMPNPPCVVLTEINRVSMSTTRVTNTLNVDVLDLEHVMPARLDIQMDFYAGQAAEMCTTAQTMIRSAYAAESDVWPDGIVPLYCNEGFQSPLITGEQQYESRWTLTVSLQYNAPVTVTMQYFDTLGTVETIPADIVYPVE